jgi:hypothetical protein
MVHFDDALRESRVLALETHYPDREVNDDADRRHKRCPGHQSSIL